MRLFRPAWAFAFALASVACGGGVDVRRVEVLPASWSVEEIDVRGGEVRLAGELEADPRTQLLDFVDWCAQRPVGRGLWTGPRLVWWFSAEDVAAVIGCKQSFAMTARRDATSMPDTPSSAIGVRLGIEMDSEASDGVHMLAMSSGPNASTTSVTAADPDGADVRLAVAGAIFAPAARNDGDVRFDVPTVDLVRAALRRGSLRVFGGGRMGVARVQLYVAGLLANAPDPPPETVEAAED